MKRDQLLAFRTLCFEPGQCGLGDLLLAIADIRASRDCLVVLPSSHARLAPLFQGVAPVLVMESVFDDLIGTPRDSTPRIDLTAAELEMGRKMIEGIAKPIAVCINTSKHWAHLRECDSKLWQQICDDLQLIGKTPIQFGVSSNLTPIQNVRQMVDLPVRTLAAVYAAIGTYIGVDTGDRWLMTAVGGQAFVAHPPDCSDYQHSFWHRPCEGRVAYFHFDDIRCLYDTVARG